MPGLFGLFGRHRTILDRFAGFLAANHITTGLLVLPLATARDAGLLLVAAQILLAAAGGLALADLARALGLRAALAAAVLYELAAPAIGIRDWSGLVVLFACPAFLATLERNIAAPRSASLRLAAAISVVATFCTDRVAFAVLAFGILWLLLRLLPPGPIRRTIVLRRIAVASLLALLLTWPLLVLDLPFRIVGALPFGGVTLDLPDLRSLASGLTGLKPAVAASPIALLLPAIGLACLAAAPLVERTGRGGTLRLLLFAATIAALAALIATVPQAGPPFLGGVALLCGIALSDAARQAVPVRLRVAVAIPLLAADFAIALGQPVSPWAAGLNALALVATLLLAGTGWRAASLPPIASAAAIAVAFAP